MENLEEQTISLIGTDIYIKFIKGLPFVFGGWLNIGITMWMMSLSVH